MKKTNLATFAVSTKGGTFYKVNFLGGEVAEVSLVSYPVDASQVLARATKGYTGYYENNPVPPDEMPGFMKDLKSTKLGTPAEMVNFVFLVRDVPRSWTHQAVRTRVGASVVQESTRFIGSRSEYNVMVPNTMLVRNSLVRVREEYISGNLSAITNYANLVEQEGVESQDARNLLPHSLLTHMYWSLTLKALMGIHEVRWCCQAEPSTWIPVMRQMKQLITTACGEEVASFLSAPIIRGENCGFHASFDRPCVWKPRP